MATLTRRIDVYSNGSIKVTAPVDLYRVGHDTFPWRLNRPEVYRLDPDHHVVFTEPIQWMWRYMNPKLSITQMTALYSNNLAFTNGTGFPGNANYMTGEELESTDPRFDQARVMGGAFLKARFIYNGRVYPEFVDTRKPLKSVAEIMSKLWLHFEAVNIDWIQDDESGTVFYDSKKWRPIIRPLKGGWRLPVYVPVIASRDVSFSLSKLTKIPAGTPLPSPYKYTI